MANVGDRVNGEMIKISQQNEIKMKKSISASDRNLREFVSIILFASSLLKEKVFFWKSHFIWELQIYSCV